MVYNEHIIVNLEAIRITQVVVCENCLTVVNTEQAVLQYANYQVI